MLPVVEWPYSSESHTPKSIGATQSETDGWKKHTQIRVDREKKYGSGRSGRKERTESKIPSMKSLKKKNNNRTKERKESLSQVVDYFAVE